MTRHFSSASDALGQLFLGCAGWTISLAEKQYFPGPGTALQRYARVLPAVEVNTSFYRSHRPETYARWRDSVPPSFRFSVKMPRTITHHRRLQHTDQLLAQFLQEAGALQEKLACLLVQLPPTLRFDPIVAATFFTQLRAGTGVPVAVEPRHASWFSAEGAALLEQFRLARVAADPAIVERAAPVRSDTVYVRLHGSPVMYQSSYPEPYLDRLAAELRQRLREGKSTWCIFDNTAVGSAVPNALSLLARFEEAQAGTARASKISIG
ncbi:MAG TPA: DUF72 domain-containing protein [Burkholderiaceae bacterium]|nr:DUF72 domain-containing protein [Burkholderiaceae bacterium]